MLLFNRLWGNLEDAIRRDDRGNDLRPRQVEKPSWQLKTLTDSGGYYDEPYLFYFDQGQQTLSLTSSREPMAIDYIELYQEKTAKSYAEIKKNMKSQV